MDRILTEYLQKNKNTDREVHYTHVSCVRPKGRYAFGRKELEGFWDLYCERLQSNPDMVSGMAEIPQEYSMLVVDGDIKKKIAEVIKHHPEMKVEVMDGDQTRVKYNPVRLYTQEHVEKVILAYQEVIKSVTKDYDPEHSVCILLEKPPYISDDYVKSGFHLAFINYFCSKSLQDTYLIPRVVDKVNEMEIFKDLGYSQSSEVLDISKKHTNPKPWLLYGSRKSENAGTYTVSRAYADGAEELTLEEAFSDYQIYDGFERPIEYKSFEDFHKLYPRVFSVNPSFRKTVEIVPMFDSTANISFTEQRAEKDDVKYDQTLEQQLATARELVQLLDISRAEKRDEWLEIGWILYAISQGTEEGLQLWIEFSQQAVDKFSLEVCLREWSRMYKGNFTLGSLKYYAKVDSPEDYEIFWRKRLEKMVMKALNGSHNDLAKALYESYSTEFVCASLKPEMWFYYTNHHWEPMEEGIELRRKISDDLVHRYSSMIKDQFDQLAEADDDDNGSKKEAESRIASIYKLIKNLKCNTFKNSIMKECREVFYDRNFLKRLGKGKYLLALQNGVYDLQNHIFRAGKPEDYIAFQMPIMYREFNELDPWVVETANFFEKLFPDPSIRKYMLERLAEMLVGGNKRKHVYFWTGRGNNGKSVLKLLIQRMFGAYFIDIPNSVIVGQKPKSGQACPELARADRGVRAAFTQEPNKKDLINTGALKEYSGNDTFYARTLFEKGGEIEPMFKLVMICLAGDTRVSLSSGVSFPIGKMGKLSVGETETTGESLLTWDEKSDGIRVGKYSQWLNQGEKECVELTLADGRTIKCTPDHRFLTEDNKWVEAQNIVLGETKLKMGIENPCCEDFFDDSSFIFETGKMKFDMRIMSDRLKAMAFCRLMGYQLNAVNKKVISVENLLDVERVLDDIELLTGKREDFVDCEYSYQINLPEEIEGFSTATTANISEYPSFLVREFIAGNLGNSSLIFPGENSEAISLMMEKTFGVTDLKSCMKNIGLRYASRESYTLSYKACFPQSNLEFNIPRDCRTLPVFVMTVMSRKSVGILPVFDLTVDGTHNFVANGIITHNCNDLPGITNSDPAVQNRMRVIPFEATFTDNPPASEEEQFRTKTFLKDENFDEKLEKMLEPFFWMLTQLLPKIKRIIYEPPKVKEATEKYLRSQDIYAQFIDERMIIDDSKSITIMDFFQAFRDWHRQAFPGVPIPSRNDCNDYLVDVWGTPINYRWTGHRLRVERDDINDGRAEENQSVDYENAGNGSNPLAGM